MKEKKKNLKQIIGGLFCFIMLSASVLIPVQKVNADTYTLGDTSIYTTKYLKNVYPSIKQIGQAYVVGTDEVADFWARIAIEKVPLGTKIQGVAIDEKYLDQNNMANLEVLYSSVITAKRPNYDKSIAYMEGEDVVLQVVAVNGDKVIFWSNGYRAFSSSGVTEVSCNSENWLLSHPPGFYQIPASKVWLNIATEKYNVIPTGQENKVAATGNTTGSSLAVRMKPSTEGRPAYRLNTNTSVSLASTEKVAAIDGSGDTYYKLIFKGDLDNGYMSTKRYCYVNSLYVDVNLNGANKPSDLQPAYIINTSKELVNLRSEKNTSSGLVGKVALNTNVKYSPSESDSEWTTLWFSGKKCYIPSKYIRPGEYIKILETGRLAVKDIVNGQYVVRWDPTNTNKGYTIAITTTDNNTDLGKFQWYWLYTNKRYTKNEFTIDSSYFKDGTKNRNKIYFRVTANGSNKTLSIELPRLKVLEETNQPTWDKKGGILYKNVKDTSIYFTQYGINSQFQIATDKKFTKNVKSTVSVSSAIYFRNLKPNKTYYVRFRHRQYFTTADGNEVSVYGPWSKAKMMKTKKTPVYDYVKDVSVHNIKNGQYIVTWNKVRGAKTYTVEVKENKTGKVLYRNKKYKKSTITVKNKWFKNGKKEVVVSVKSNKKTKNRQTARVVLDLPTQTTSSKNVKTAASIYSDYIDTDVVAAKCSITIRTSGGGKKDGVQVQFSKDTDFKNAKIHETSEGISVKAAGFDMGQTYYYRYRHIRVVQTSSGEKYLYGKWSAPIKITTPNKIKVVEIKG